MRMSPALANPMIPEPRRVLRVRRESADTMTLVIDASDRPMSFRPGQFNMLYGFALGDIPISMSGDPARGNEIVHTIKILGAVSRGLCGLRKGAWVGVRGPYGTPWPLDAVRGKDLILIAGGLGLAPLVPVVYHVLAHRANFGRVWLFIGARTPGDLLFRREIAKWQRREDLSVVTTVDRAGADWKGRVGVVPALLAEARLEPARTAAFICGPETMMRFTVREAARHGLADENLYLSMERNMKCAIGLCGHCQFGPDFVCRNGPILRFDAIRSRFWRREV